MHLQTQVLFFDRLTANRRELAVDSKRIDTLLKSHRLAGIDDS